MKIIGLTGGIGSGKSTISEVFKTLGVPVFNADLSGREVLESDEEAKSSILELLGPDAYKDNMPDRKFIASVVFSDQKKLRQLNDIIHPAVGRRFAEWLKPRNEKHTYCLREAAILFESESYLDCDKIVCVTAPEELRIERVIERDRVTAEHVQSRVQQQLPQSEVAERSDFVIVNDSIAPVIPQVMKIHKQLENA